MTVLSLLTGLGRRPRVALLVGALVAVAAAVVVANQPASQQPSSGSRSLVIAAATPEVVGTPSPRTPTPPQPSGMRMLHRAMAFRDDSSRHHGAPPVSAATGILVDAETGAILWQRDMHAPRPPASTTKIVSTLVAQENLEPSQSVRVTSDALIQKPDETRLGIQAGDVYTVTELLYAMLLVSANDAATALAADTVGLDRFVRAMNEQMAALGLHDSHFITPVGLDDPEQQASAYDLAAVGLAEYDAFPLFRQIVATKDVDVPATDGHIAYHLHNLSRILEAYPSAVGIKPGWTGDAGYCLVAMATRGGHRLVAVVLDDPHMVDESRALFEWGFAQEGVPPLPTPTPVPTPTPHH